MRPLSVTSVAIRKGTARHHEDYDVKTFLVHDAERPGRNYTFVKIYTDEGLTGLGEAGITWKELAVQGLVETYRPILVGMDPSRIEHIWQTFGAVSSSVVAISTRRRWRPSTWPCGTCRGKALGAPVYDLLGGRTRDYVRCYCHVQGDAHGAPHAGIEEMVECAKQQVAGGWRYVRFGAGETRALTNDGVLEQTDGLRWTVDAFGSLRDALGPGVESAWTCISARRPPTPSSWPVSWPR